MEKLLIKFVNQKIGTEIEPPKFATSGSAGMDLSACIDESITLQPGERALVPTGIAIALPGPSYVALVFARSGLPNGVGVIDSDYRGEIKCGLVNFSDSAYTIECGERIAQLIVMNVHQPKLEIVTELPETERGAGGFGSTGKK